jgi:hypothetical protein
MFQTHINNQPAPGEAGDFYGVNPRASMIGGPGMYNAPEGGLVVGRFAWVDPATGQVSQVEIPGGQLGILHRENNAVLVEFLAEAVYSVNEGLPVALFDQGDFWALFAAGATPGQRVWADPSDGSAIAGDATAPVLDSFTADAGFGGTARQGGDFTIAVTANVATISALTGWVEAGDSVTSASLGTVTLGARLTGSPGGTGTFTQVHADFVGEAGTAANNHMTVTVVAQGAVEVGSVTNLTGNPTVTALGTGTGGVGNYVVDGAAQHVASGARTATNTVLNVTAVSSGTIDVGDEVGSPALAGTQIVSQLSGTPGGIGTYRVSALNYFTSQAVGDEAVATPWFVNSVAGNGEIAIISTWG